MYITIMAEESVGIAYENHGECTTGPTNTDFKVGVFGGTRVAAERFSSRIRVERGFEVTQRGEVAGFAAEE